MSSDHQVHDNGFTLSGSSRMYFSSRPTDGFEADAYWQVSRTRCSKVNDVLVSGYFWHFVHIHIHIRLNIALIPKHSLALRHFPIQPFDQGRFRKYYWPFKMLGQFRLWKERFNHPHSVPTIPSSNLSSDQRCFEKHYWAFTMLLGQVRLHQKEFAK